MDDIAAKKPYDGVSTPAPSDEVLPDTEYNDRRVELQGAVTDSSQALDAADAGQLSKAIFANAVAAQSMLDSGAVNSVVLTPVSGANGLRVATPIIKDYSLLDGAIFNFQANNTNTGNITVNVGQTGGTLIGAVPLFLQDGSTQVPVGEVVAGSYYSVRYTSAGGGAFIVTQGIPLVGYKSINSVVFNTSMSGVNSWQDLDLSAITGIKRVLVMLQVSTVTSGISYQLKPKDRGSSIFANHTVGSFTGPSGFFSNNTSFQYIMCETDSSGVVQHGSSNAAATFTVTLIGFVR